MNTPPIQPPAAPPFQLVLASTSPRRRELLAALGCEFRLESPHCDELTLPPRLTILEMAQLLPQVALAKARDVAQRCGPGDLVIGADTVVYHRGAVLGKPADADEARLMLRRLSGRVHRVYTALAVIGPAESPGQRVSVTGIEETDVRFRILSDREIELYTATGEPMDKAGAYGIQGLAGLFVSGIKGRYDNVVGFPLATLYRLLKQLGFDLMEHAAGRFVAER